MFNNSMKRRSTKPLPKIKKRKNTEPDDIYSCSYSKALLESRSPGNLIT